MTNPVIEADYLIVGAGAAGMAFADSLLAETQTTIVMADRHHRPGGHWNDAYSFVRLHQPAALYGVNSRPLGTGAKDEVGLNKGLYELASGQEVLSHFDLAMQQRFLASGRVAHLGRAAHGHGAQDRRCDILENGGAFDTPSALRRRPRYRLRAAE